MYCFDKIYDSGIFQGKNKRKNYFEGWYLKLIDRSMEHGVAIIPGIALGKSCRDTHAFIQVLLAGNQVCYYEFDIKEFHYSRNRFAIRIGDNYFSDTGVNLNLKGKNIEICGKAHFNNIHKLPKSIYMPGIMGPFSYIPWMECYHGVINVHHDVIGHLIIGGKRIDFTGGCGYIEKDWGSSFPRSWVWLQSNHFLQSDGTIMFSAARIPMLGTSFPGFLGFLRLGDRNHIFATYTGAKLRTLACTKDRVKIILEDRKYILVIQLASQEGAYLKAPHRGLMNRTIQESINNRALVRLYNHKKQLIYQDIARNAGFEIVLEEKHIN